MTLVAPENGTRTTRNFARRTIPHDRLAMLSRQVVRATVPDLGHNDDFGKLVMEAIAAFAQSEGSCSVASAVVERRVHTLGATFADNKITLERIGQAFDCIHAAVQRGLQMTLGNSVSGHAVLRLRRNIVSYVRQLQVVLTSGWEQRQREIAMSRDDRLKGVRARVFRGSSRLDHLFELSGFDPTAEFIAIVSVHSLLPSGFLHDPEVIAGDDAREAVIPFARTADLANELSEQVVVGPPAGLDRITDSIDLVRRGAALLRASQASDDRMIVPCNDLLGLLIVKGNRVLADLLVAKHLVPLHALSRDRRLQLGELLLDWLERGMPLSQLANTLGIPPQTAHSRMQAIRKLFGGSLEDPTARLEIILALRTALPEWQAEVAL
ncbi:helix-turn-helix domain-containing protein [Mumia sp. DW29H23]|uniref:helix-turn-helix domain-containing protein n=1 Tax=Mumia sp. DW29H23 TaxID=3421241 RepID=UPI003D69A5AE